MNINIMNMNMNINYINHDFSIGDTTSIKLISVDPKFEPYKSRMTEKMFLRWIKPAISKDKISYKSVRAINFFNTLYRITIRKEENKEAYCKVEKMTINGWVVILTKEDLNTTDFNDFINKMGAMFHNKSVVEESDLQIGYSMMDDIELDFITTIILLFND